jgi:CMP-N,N'-diacetyllegionaminic acid synthase
VAGSEHSRPTVLALVTARGGSKGVPRKNVRLFCGLPLIAHTISVARKTPIVDRCVTSTDDQEIADVARAHGAEVPFLRPAELAEDETPDLPVFEHALAWLEAHEGYRPDVVVHLRPTSPLRRVEHVQHAVELLLRHPEADSVRTVSPPAQNPFKMWRVVDGVLRPLVPADIPEPYNSPRQRLPQVYWQNGYVDVAWRRTILKGSMTGGEILPLVIDDPFPVDLDSAEAFEIAEVAVRRLGISVG